MNARAVALVALKCMGLYVLLYGLIALIVAFLSLQIPDQVAGLDGWAVLLWQTVPALLYMGLGLLLVCSTEGVLRWCFRELDAAPVPGSHPDIGRRP